MEALENYHCCLYLSLTIGARMKNNLSSKRAALNRFYFGDPFRPPRKAVVIFFLLAWLISGALVVLAMTDFFQQPFFNRQYTMAYFLMAGATVSVVRVCIAYYKSRYM
jgi:hypothetical protein